MIARKMENIKEQIQQIETAIKALDTQRTILGDELVETTLAPLREKLAALRAQAQAADKQQRKLVSVLFADVSGFTALSEQMDAEDVTDLINALWQRLDACIIERGGWIDKHIGDEIMALWGVDEARENDSRQAAKAALELQAALNKFCQERAALGIPPIAMRIGLHTGPVLLGEVATTHEFTAIGDTVNLASRLQKAAPVGGVLISQDTFRHVQGAFDLQPLEPMQIKGKVEPVRTYLVLGARSVLARQRGVEGIETHLIGRDAERSTLQEAFEKAMQQGETQRIALLGDPGVGKSRLLHEFDIWLEKQSSDLVIFKGNATPEIRSQPYSILRDLFRQRFNILDSDTMLQVRDKFEAGMCEYLTPEQAHLVAHQVGFNFEAITSPETQTLLHSPAFTAQAQMYLDQYFQHFTAHNSTVILLEDLHWADNTSLDFITRLGKALPERRLLIVGVARPELDERRPDWIKQALPHCLELLPLEPQDSRALVNEILQRVENLPEDLVDLVVKSAEGNPFYVEELVKMLIDDGVILPDETSWQADLSRLRQVRVPTTLVGVLQARLDGLPQDEKNLLQRASVVGRLFWDRLVKTMHAEESLPSPAQIHQMESALESVQERELVFKRRHSSFYGTYEYIFKHALLRDVAYDTVLLRLRRIYHAQVAAWLEAYAGDRAEEYLGLIAWHYEMAGNLPRALHYLERAAGQAYRISAYQEARVNLERAVKMADNVPPDIEALPISARPALQRMQAQLGETLYSLGEYQLAEETLHSLLQEADIDEQPGSAATAQRILGQIAIARADYESARQLSQQSLALAQSARDHLAAARALRNLGLAEENLGNLYEAAEYYQQSLSLFERVGDLMGEAGALANLGSIAEQRSKTELAGQLFAQAKERFQRIGFRWGMAYTLNRQGGLALAAAHFSGAITCYRESYHICQEIDHRWGMAMALIGWGQAETGAGQFFSAGEHLRQGLQIAQAIHLAPTILYAVNSFARLFEACGQPERAASLYALIEAAPDTEPNDQKHAQQRLAHLAETLDPQAYRQAVKAGQETTIERTTVEMLEQIVTSQ